MPYTFNDVNTINDFWGSSIPSNVAPNPDCNLPELHMPGFVKGPLIGVIANDKVFEIGDVRALPIRVRVRVRV